MCLNESVAYQTRILGSVLLTSLCKDLNGSHRLIVCVSDSTKSVKEVPCSVGGYVCMEWMDAQFF
jgi:hypothetical protein